MQALSTQLFGQASDFSVFALSLVVPPIIGFVLIVGLKQLLRAKWRGYWDAV